DGQPRHHLAVLPRDGQRLGRITPLDDPAGVALELVAATDAQVTADGEEPPGQSLDVGDGVPEIGSGGGIRVPSDGDLRRYPVARPRPHLPTRHPRRSHRILDHGVTSISTDLYDSTDDSTPRDTRVGHATTQIRARRDPACLTPNSRHPGSPHTT